MQRLLTLQSFRFCNRTDLLIAALCCLAACREGEDCKAEGKAHHTGILSRSSSSIRHVRMPLYDAADAGLQAAAAV
jgi:hypothetical protein